MDQPGTLSRPRTIVTGGSGFIGRNLTAALRSAGHDVLAISRSEPRGADQIANCARVEILDSRQVEKLVREFEPSAIVHLAAATGFLTNESEQGFRINVEGTRNVLRAAARCGTVHRCIFTSSYVVTLPRVALRRREMRRVPLLYDESKQEAERVVQTSQELNCSWCIIRPSPTWGPWFSRPYRDFFIAIARGRYFHPGRADAPKRLSFVGNACYQILRLLCAPEQDIHRRTFHLADYETTTLRAWADLVADRLSVRRPRAMREALVRIGAIAGDALSCLGYSNPPLTLFRLKNIRSDTSNLPVADIQAVAGDLPFTMEAGIDRTIDWLRAYGLVPCRRHS